MHPAVAGLIGAGLALLGCLFAWLIHRGREGLRQIEAQRAGARVSAELRQVLGLMQTGALLVGPHDEILVVNEPGETMGLVRGTRVGFTELLDVVRAVRTSGIPYDGVVVRQRQPGAEALELTVRVSPMEDEDVLIFAVDESAAKRVDAVRRDFVANISHELKTPIGAISVLSEAVEVAKDDPEAVERFALRLQRETARLAELTNQIIDLSRLQTENPMLEHHVVDLSEVIDEAVSRSRERAAQREVSVIVARTTEVRVLGDRWQLADAVANLVQNAISYSDERARVTISLALDGDVAEVKVSDNGIGIRPEDQDRIFERFFRVDYGRSRESGGTGLGLSIVRHIAVSHGGDIRVWSRPGQGSTFTLSLPAYLGAPDDDPEDEE
ncbi:MAG TPA: HAMP domain-containing sensor histidine kinase [Arachnia sp.]|jgi:two-component system sensor histidine kinase SenX3|nr:two-component sensor histidine kinase [Propionibacteriaceae bacterium]HQD22571.1 HAMP domain-containing sensor histidine kinase [Arachnia sp.]